MCAFWISISMRAALSPIERDATAKRPYTNLQNWATDDYL